MSISSYEFLSILQAKESGTAESSSSRELNLISYDAENERPARVLYTVTKGEPNPITMLDLIVSSLRFHPALIVPAEVRDGAAYQAAIAGQTGHTVLTSFHADGAQDAYKRLVALCNTAGPYGAAPYRRGILRFQGN